MKLKDVFIVTRAWSFSITFISVTTGTILAWQEAKISPFLYLTCLLGAFLFHAGANTLNDYFDVKNKIDSPSAPPALYRPHPIFTNILSQKELLIFSLILFSLSLIIGLFLAVLRTVWLWPMILGGLFFAFFYTYRISFGLKYFALGELSVFLAFGPLMMEGAYAVQRNILSWRVFYLSLPFGLLVALVLLANNLRDIDFDRSSGIKTISGLLGRVKGVKLYCIIAFSAYLLIFCYILTGILTWQGLLVFFSLPLALRLCNKFSQHIPFTADAETSKLPSLFGLLLILALISEKHF